MGLGWLVLAVVVGLFVLKQLREWIDGGYQ